MTRLLVAILIVAGVWMTWWAIGSAAHERALSTWIDIRRAEGWAADVSEVETVGFPNRFDTTLSEVRLADPATGVAWSADFLQFLSLAYKPHQVIAVLPDSHVFSTPLQTLTITHDGARGSLFLEPSTALGLDRSTFVVDQMRVSSTLGWRLNLTEGRMAADKVEATQSDYRVGMALTNLQPTADSKRRLDPAGALPDVIDTVQLDATLGFTKPWDRHAIEDARPQFTSIALTDLSASWGRVNFRAAGTLTVDEEGIPTGQINVRAVEWRRLMDMAIGTGLVAETVRPALEAGLDLIASLSGRPDTLDVELNFRRGRIQLGPIPLGPAPRLVLR